ncbi:MAG: hypothetical protein J6A59_18815 [Lachnospiraceae bacterium]|nr:hypothetical protein [Lachnospiraceae bacterium]
MNCPICGMDTNGAQFCPSCGADMSAFAGVSKDKVIVNQTPEQQLAAGDDSVTQLIPENYMNATGDDSVTQLIPENFMNSKGDDSATVMLDPSQVQMTMPNTTPAFSQTPTGSIRQPQNMQAAGMGVQPGYQQFNQGTGMNAQSGYQQFNQGAGMAVQPGIAQSYQAGYNQPTSYKAKNSGVPVVSKAFSLASLIIMLALLICCVVLITKPLYYITQSYVGNYITGEELEDEVIGQDEDDYQEANKAARVFVGAVSFFLLIGLMNSVSCFMRVNSGCMKSPVNKAVGAFVMGLIGAAIFVVLKVMLDDVVSDGIDYGDLTPEKAKMFNVYSMAFVLCIVSAVVNFVNIFTASAAKKVTR